jgi:hypothetical protein
MTSPLYEKQNDVTLKLPLDFAGGDQVTVGYLSGAQELAIEYVWHKDSTEVVDRGAWVTGVTYELLSDGRYALVYVFDGTDAVPDDAEGWLELRARIKSITGRFAYGDTARIQVLPNEAVDTDVWYYYTGSGIQTLLGSATTSHL